MQNKNEPQEELDSKVKELKKELGYWESYLGSNKYIAGTEYSLAGATNPQCQHFALLSPCFCVSGWCTHEASCLTDYGTTRYMQTQNPFHCQPAAAARVMTRSARMAASDFFLNHSNSRCVCLCRHCYWAKLDVCNKAWWQIQRVSRLG